MRRETRTLVLTIVWSLTKEPEMGQQGKCNTCSKKKKTDGSFSSIFMHADRVDLCLMALGLLGSIGDGFSTPLVLLISGKMMNSVGKTSTSLQANFLENINKVTLSISLYFYSEDIV